MHALEISEHSPSPSGCLLSNSWRNLGVTICGNPELIGESYNELVHKVSWPTRKELAQSSVIVLIASIILALIVWLMDYCFENIMTFIYGLL